jgi:hypothetical protein
MALASQIPGEEYYRVAIGQGMYTAELPSNIPDGYASICYNMVASGDSVENRIGIRRSTIDWKIQEISPAWGDTSNSDNPDNRGYFCQIDPWGRLADKIAFVWGARGYTVPGNVLVTKHTLNMVRSLGGTGDGFMSVDLDGEFLGMCDYNTTVYFSVRGLGVKKINVVNWTADTMSWIDIASSGTGTVKGLMTFKDRLWGWNNNKLYYTDVPSTPGGNPETWAFATNVVPLMPPNGSCTIKQVIPLGNKLAIFTTNGFYTLLVEGSPASWILRILDSRSVSTTSQCAFESKGIIYYVNTQGVWATNNLTSTKLSAVIEDQWFLAKGTRIHTLVPYEDGMIVSIAKAAVSTPAAASDTQFFSKDFCRTFYSKLDPIGWSEWNVNTYGMGTGAYNLAMVWSATDKIPTFLNSEPTVYAMVWYTDSTDAAKTKAVMQPVVFDGGSDTWVERDGTVRTLPVGIFLKTKRVDGGNPYNIKRAKRGMLELFTSDASHEFTTSWDIDATNSEASEVRTKDKVVATVGVGSNLLQVLNQFYYRRVAFNLRAELQSDSSQIKVKDLAIAQDTGRAEFEDAR